MSKKKIGLVFSYNEQWIGGTYYVMNLINALNHLPDEQKPALYIFSVEKDYDMLLKEVHYPYMQFVRMDENPDNAFLQIANKVSIRLSGKKLFTKRFQDTVDAVFPFQRSNYLESVPMEKRIYWIADFQDRHLPHFFSATDLEDRNQRNRWVANHAHHLVLSSNAVFGDLQTFYSDYSAQVHILHFAVTHPEYRSIDFSSLASRYALDRPYFFSPNQFWAHKNQLVVIQAAEKLKQQGKDVCICFSGKENDSRNPGYTENLKAYVKEKGLEKEVRFLGFLDRRDQLQLMNHSLAVVQPSLFEGWSTSIEDAMAMNKLVVASSIPVNMEQLGDKGHFFDPQDANALACKLDELSIANTSVSYPYNDKLRSFAEEFLSILEK